MSLSEFEKVVEKHILTSAEVNLILEYLLAEERDKTDYIPDLLPFRIDHRTQSTYDPDEIRRYIALSVYTKNFLRETCYKLDLSFPLFPMFSGLGPHFMCDGSQKRVLLGPNHAINVVGLGFQGPIEKDSMFDVTIQIKQRTAGRITRMTEKYEKKLWAQKGEKFYFRFDEPITLDESMHQNMYTDCSEIHYSIKGPKISNFLADRNLPYCQSYGVRFRLDWENQGQLVEILFRKIEYSWATL